MIAAPSAPLTPSTSGSGIPRQPAANSRYRSGPTWPSLTAYRNGHESPASSTISHCVRPETGISAVPIANAATSSPIHSQVAVPAASRPNGRIIGMNVGG